MRYKCDHDKNVLLANFARRGWTRSTVSIGRARSPRAPWYQGGCLDPS